MGEIGQLEEEAAKRKARLAALKRKIQGNEGGAENPEKKSTDEDSELPVPIFRSYQPVTEDLAGNTLPVAEPGRVEDHIQDTLSGSNKAILEELDFMNLAPRKPDWDLKRDISKKLEKLEKRTARAIGEIIRDRLKTTDLADAVLAGASYAAAAMDDE